MLKDLAHKGPAEEGMSIRWVRPLTRARVRIGVSEYSQKLLSLQFLVAAYSSSSHSVCTLGPLYVDTVKPSIDEPSNIR